MDGADNRRGDARAIVAGTALLLFAVVVLIAVQRHELGSITRPGPGAFPTVVSLILIGISGAILLRGIRAERHSLGRVPAVSLLAVTAGFVGFGLLIRWAGLIPATAVLVFCASLGFGRLRLVETIILFVFLSAFSAFVFVWMLRLPIRLGWW